MAKKGKFIVIYGANNLGKSTQVQLLKAALEAKGIRTQVIKYPVYDLEPTGPKINAVLREQKPLPEKELQQLFAQNRRDFEPTLKECLNAGAWVIAEDYTGTGIAWGMTRDVALKDLESMNADLLHEDIAILLFGKRFHEGIEKSHRNETDDNIWQSSYQKHLQLAKRYGWAKVNANDTPENVTKAILRVLQEKQ